MATRTDIIVGVFKRLKDLGAELNGKTVVARYMQERTVKTEKGSSFHPAFIRFEDELIEIRVFSLGFVQVLSNKAPKAQVLKGCANTEEIVKQSLALHGYTI